MNILYKYCDQVGVVKILESLELKLPYVSEVNDPLECSPVPYCPDDKSAMEAQCLRTFKRNNISPPTDWKQKMCELTKTGELQKDLTEGLRKVTDDLKQKSCRLSVSKTANNTVMWAHYSDKHKGGVIGINSDKVFYEAARVVCGLRLYQVEYSEKRPKLNALDDFYSKEFFEKYGNTLLTKSDEWTYEKEFRCTFSDDYLKSLKQQGLASLKDFNAKKTWFLRLNPESIREIIFGLYTEESLKSAIRKLIQRAELQHVKLYQAKESETYTLNLIELENG